MQSARWARLDELFAAAEPLAGAARQALVDAAFAAQPDPELRAELEALLRAASEPLEARLRGAVEGQVARIAAEPFPERLGPYRILHEIGRGGMATVYAAARDDREFERLVAIKILRRGMDTDDIVRRLRRERQILANLDHPGIARLLDGGRAPDGRPYVVMEHIAGEPIDLYCARHHLDLAARLRLFRQVCAAVHHAHKNLILHRDIKPSNILVTAGGEPKLLDFGIAKVLAGDGAEEPGEEPAAATLTGLRLLTPAWASPEQVRGESLSTASDVYSLGLLLYLLVAGRRAYELDPRRPAEVERIVGELMPPPPGRGDDLDLIVMAALRKEPERRYASAEQLGEDVRRYLENLPVAARKDTAAYRAGKFVRRHRWAVAAAVAVFLALAAAAAITRRQALEAREQKERAEQVAAFLTEVFETSDPSEARGRSLTAREVLDQGVQRLRYRLKDDPERRADLLATLGRVYQKLALLSEAEALLEEAIALRGGREAASPALPPLLRDAATLAYLRGQWSRGREAAGKALELERRLGAPPLEVAATLILLADIDTAAGSLETAEAGYREALALQEGAAGGRSEAVADTHNRLGELYFRQGLVDRAEEEIAAGLELRRQLLPPDHPDLATSLNNLAVVRRARGDLAGARALLSEVLVARRRVFGDRHLFVAALLNNLATVEGELGEARVAIAHSEEALEINRRALGGSHHEIAANLHNLAAFYLQAGDPAKAAAFGEEALAMRRATLGEHHPLVAQTLQILGEIAFGVDDVGRAIDHFRAAVATDPRRSLARAWLGRALVRGGDREAGCTEIAAAYRELAADLGAEHPYTRETAGFSDVCPRGFREESRVAGNGSYRP